MDDRFMVDGQAFLSREDGDRMAACGMEKT